MPTQELLTEGPYRYCRNPMTLGTILAYLGIAVAVGTTAGTVLVLGPAALLVAYLKHLEERELAERFGKAYQAYRQDVPFMIPRPAAPAVTVAGDFCREVARSRTMPSHEPDDLQHPEGVGQVPERRHHREDARGADHHSRASSPSWAASWCAAPPRSPAAPTARRGAHRPDPPRP